MNGEDPASAKCCKCLPKEDQNEASGTTAPSLVETPVNTDKTSCTEELFQQLTSKMEAMRLEFCRHCDATQLSKDALGELKESVMVLTNVQTTMMSSHQKNIDQADNCKRLSTQPNCALQGGSAACGAAVTDKTVSQPNDDVFDFFTVEDIEGPEEKVNLQPNDCGVCHKDATDNMVVNIRCGHYPYCLDCVNTLVDTRNNIPLLERDDNWSSFHFLCPQCSGKVQETFLVRKVKLAECSVTMT